MNDFCLTFHYELDDPERDYDEDDHSWWAISGFNGDRLGLCDTGIRSYIGLPTDCEEFDAVFSVGKPIVPNFELHRTDTGVVKLRTEDGIGWYEFIAEFLDSAYNEGYRYLRVEFDE